MTAHIRLYVKFRAFGITFHEARHQYAVSIGVGGTSWQQEPYTEVLPDGAKRLYDNRGVKLHVWG